MKRLHYLSLFIVALFATSCSYNELPEELRVEPIFEDKITLNVETRAETYEGKALDQEYFVTAQDLENFVKFRRDASKRPDLSVKEVVSYGFDSSQTLFYILNYDKGWEVVSADKRTQPTLAHGDEGSFTMDTDNEAMKFWMNRTANGVLVQRQTSEDETTTRSETADDPEEVNEYVQFWNDISPTTQNTRGGIEIPTWGPLNPIDTTVIIGIKRRYYLPNVVNYRSEITTRIGSTLLTSWGQGAPWNNFCPFRTDTITPQGEGVRSPAGCTATAGAQLLYHLKTVNNWNLQAPMDAFCNGDIDNYEQSFSYSSPLVWNYMAVNSNGTLGQCYKSAVLIAHTGYISNMEYGNTGSGASLKELQSGLANYYNISCDRASFSSSTAIANLNFSPVVISGFYNQENGHSWIIDEYIKTTTYIDRYYIETTQELSYPELCMLTIEDATGYITDTSSSSQFHMNWGWDGYCDGYYGLSSDRWQVDSDDGPYDLYTKMLYNFTLNQ